MILLTEFPVAILRVFFEKGEQTDGSTPAQSFYPTRELC